MKLETLTLVTVLIAGAAFAGETGPLEVMYGDGGAVDTSLSGNGGDAATGATIMTTKYKGNCIACHEVTALSESPFHGEIGPSLDGAGSRWSQAELRGIVADAKKTFDGSVMPSFYKVNGYIRPGNGYTGKAAEGDLPPLLSAQEIEDVVAFLLTLKN